MPESANFSNIYKFYDLINTVLTLGFDKSWRSKAANNLTGTSVLDLGSGTGAAFAQLTDYETTALDPDKKMLELNIFENKVLGTAEKLPFEDKSFDNIFCSFVWRNISDTDKALGEIYRVLKPGGKYIVSGAIAGPVVDLDLRSLYLKDITMYGSTVNDTYVFENVIEYIEEGQIKPLVSASFPLKDIHKAQKVFMDKKFIGKLVLIP